MNSQGASSTIHKLQSLLVTAAFLTALATLTNAQSLETSDMVQSDIELLQDNELYDTRCRGGSGNNPDTWVACGARDYTSFLLNKSGYCFGEKDQASFEWVWHVCNPNSNRIQKP